MDKIVARATCLTSSSPYDRMRSSEKPPCMVAKRNLMPAPLFACMLAAALRYHIPERVLPAIWEVEHGHAGSIHSNTDGSVDMGLMQINSLWLRPLAQIVNMTPTQTAARLVSDNCFNVAASALILRSFLDETHGNLMQAIGDYHSHTPELNQQYQRKILAEAQRLYGSSRR